MHISEGVLTPAVLGSGVALAAVGTAVALRKTDYERLTTTAVLSSVFFVGSLVHIPLGPGSVHLVLNGLLGLFLGWAAFPALLVALALQAILLRYGGLAVLGVNVFDMALPAMLGHYAFRRWMARGGWLRLVGAFCCGALAVWGAVGLTALALWLSNEGFETSAQLILLAHIPVMVLEGIITALAVLFIAKVRPELLEFDRDRAAGGWA